MNRLALAGLLLFTVANSAPAAAPVGVPAAARPALYTTGPLLFRPAVGGGEGWELRRTDGFTKTLVLSAVTPKYIELYDPDRKVRYRLHPDHLEVLGPTGSIPDRPGRWVK